MPQYKDYPIQKKCTKTYISSISMGHCFIVVLTLLSRSRSEKKTKAGRERMMKIKMHILSIVLSLLTIFLILPTSISQSVSNLQQAFDSMREIPQWHCLRYRKFDLVKRCRHHRIGYKN